MSAGDAHDRALAHYLERAEEFQKRHVGDPGWIVALRAAALRSLAETGFPRRSQEEWRYSNPAPLLRTPFELPAAGSTLPDAARLEEIATPYYACSNSVFVNARYCEELVAPSVLSGQVRPLSLGSVRRAAPAQLEGRLARLVDPKRHPFAALNTAFLDDGAVIAVPDGVALEQPLHLTFEVTSDCVQHPRVLITLGRGSRAVVIQDHVCSDAALAPFTNSVTEVVCGAGSALDLLIVQREGTSAYHVSNLQARVERDARFAAHTLTLGGRFVRNDAEVALAGEGASASLRGLFVASGEGLVDNHTMVDHSLPRGTSRELYKGILAGRARGVFRGNVLVRPHAQQSDAQQSNRNLLLGDGAEIDAKPQLEIHADDVECSHGCTTGRLDGDALFYLRSRGIGELEARALLTRGFAREVLDALPVPALAAAIEDRLTELLAEAAA
jgi:Fe-S cluster assembly protein SufD